MLTPARPSASPISASAPGRFFKAIVKSNIAPFISLLHLKQSRQKLGHGDQVEQVVVEHRNQPVRLAVLHVLMVSVRDLGAIDVSGAKAAKHAPLERLQLAVRDHVLPAPPHHPEKIEVRNRRGEANAMMNGAAAEEGHVEGLPVVGDQEIVFSDDPLHLGDHGALLGVIAREELAEDEIAIPDVTEPDEKHWGWLESAGLDVEEEHPPVAELVKEAAFWGIEFRDGLRERAGLAPASHSLPARLAIGGQLFAIENQPALGIQR